jgi:hypothetical protein
MAQRLLRPRAGALPALELLDRVGLYTSMPNTTGLPPAAASRMFRLDPIPALARSYEGRMRMAEMSAMAEIFDFASGGKPPHPGPPVPSFVENLRNQWRALDALVNSRAQEQARPLVESIDQHLNQWSIGFQITVSEEEDGKKSQDASSSIWVGVTVTYGLVGFGIATTLSGTWLVSGSVHGVPLLALTLGSGTSGPGSVESGVPLDERRAQADAKLASVPSRLAATSAMFAPSRSLASAPIGAPGPKGGGPNPVSTITIGWNAIPPFLGPGPWADSGFANGDRPWMAHLIFGAASKLSLEEQKAVMQAVQSGFIPQPLIDILIDRRNAAVEEVNIEKRLWFRTDAHPANQLLGDAPDEEYRDAQIRDFNRRASTSYLAALAEERARLKSTSVLVDGMPSVRLTYGNDYTLMLFQYDYQLVSGKVLTHLSMMRTPFYLIDAIRADPNGHVYEMFFTAAAGSLLDAGNPAIGLNSILRRGEKSKFLDADKYSSELGQMIDSLGITIQDALTGPIMKYFDDLKAWMNAQPGGPAVQDPFVPDPQGTPMLNFFPSPYEWIMRRDEAVSEVITRQRVEGVGNQVRTGEVIIVLPKPVFK